MLALLGFIVWVLNIIEFFIFIAVVMSWLIAFNVINVYNSGVRAIWDSVNAILEPMCRPIRRFIPMAGGLDLAPLFLIVAIELIKQVIVPNLARAFI